MALGAQPLAHALNRALQLLARGSSFYGRASLTVRLPAIFKSQEIKPAVVWPAIPAKTNHLGFVRGYFQPIGLQPLLECSLKCRRFVSVLEARHKIVREAEQSAVPSVDLLHLVPEPEVQNVMQIHVGQHRRNNSPLRGAQCRVDDLSIFLQYACL